jgi:hypothetical protein
MKRLATRHSSPSRIAAQHVGRGVGGLARTPDNDRSWARKSINPVRRRFASSRINGTRVAGSAAGLLLGTPTRRRARRAQKGRVERAGGGRLHPIEPELPRPFEQSRNISPMVRSQRAGRLAGIRRGERHANVPLGGGPFRDRCSCTCIWPDRARWNGDDRGNGDNHDGAGCSPRRWFRLGLDWPVGFGGARPPVHAQGQDQHY